MNLQEPKNQPETIKFGDHTYTLQERWTPIDDEAGIAEGPFYTRNGGYHLTLYMPDLAYLLGQTEQPTVMHRITY